MTRYSVGVVVESNVASISIGTVEVREGMQRTGYDIRAIDKDTGEHTYTVRYVAVVEAGSTEEAYQKAHRRVEAEQEKIREQKQMETSKPIN